MMKMTFKYKCSYFNQAKNTTEVSTDAVTLDEILKSFEKFLKGSGFVFDGTIDIVPEEDIE